MKEQQKCQALSKREIVKYRPNEPTLLISIQDGDKSELPFKQRTNHITRSRYVDVLFCYFDDLDPVRLGCVFNSPFLFSRADAKLIIKFLDRHFKNPSSFERVLVHCQAGVSRSQAVALFIAKHYYKDEELYIELMENAILPEGNKYIFQLLEEEFFNQKGS